MNYRVTLLTVLFLIHVTTLLSQAGNELQVINDLKTNFSMSDFEVVSKGQLPRSFKQFLRKNEFHLSKKVNVSIRCFDCPNRKILLCAKSKKYSILCYQHTGRAWHVHLIVYKNETQEFSNVSASFQIKEKDDLLLFFREADYSEEIRFSHFSLAEEY